MTSEEFLEALERLARQAIDPESGKAYARGLVSPHFDLSRPRRFISGIAQTGLAHETILCPRALVRMPRGGVPLLVWHEWICPIGRVSKLKARGGSVEFSAEICNTRALPWIEEIWCGIRSLELFGVSVLASPIDAGRPLGATAVPWRLGEISIVIKGADPNASITHCWETRGPHHLDHWTAQTPPLPRRQETSNDVTSTRIAEDRPVISNARARENSCG